MNMEYNINMIPIDKDNNKCDWTDKNKKLKLLITLELENGISKTYEGILKETI